MNQYWTALLLLPLLVLAVLAGESQPECDLATVESGFYCEPDSRILDKKELVSDATFYACKECETAAPKAGECDLCDEALTKAKSGKDVCPECFEKPQAAEICVKDGYECPDCEDVSATAAKCEDCDQERKKVRSRALVEYVCPGCSLRSLAAGKCGEEACKGKALVRRCSESGDGPHVKAGKGASPDAG